MNKNSAMLNAPAAFGLVVLFSMFIAFAGALSLGLSVGHSQIDVGHTETITANAIGGVPSGYTFNIINKSGSIINSTSIYTTNGSATFGWNALSAGQFYANVSLQSNSVSNQTVSQNVLFNVTPMLSFNSTLLKFNSITIGQEQSITVNVKGGAAPFAYDYSIYNGTGSVIANAIYLSSLSSNAFSFNQSNTFGAGNFIANVIVTDSSGEIAGVAVNYAVIGLTQDIISPNTTTATTNIIEPTTIGSISSSSTSILTSNAFIGNVTVNEIDNNKILRSLFSAFITGRSTVARKAPSKTTKSGVISETGVRSSFISPSDLPNTFRSRFQGEVYATNVTILYGNYNATILSLVNTSVISNLSKRKITSYASFVPKGESAPLLILPNALLSGITVKANSGIKNIFTNVTFNNTLISLGSFSLPYYMAFHVSSTLNDSNVTGAVYNFSVSKAWISNSGISPTQVTLYKYISENKIWIPLPTYITGSNATSYNFSALSDSLSTYVVSFGSNAVAGNVNPETVILPTGYKLYICGAGANYTFATSGTAFTWTQDIGAPLGAPINNGENASIGHQSSNSCSAYTTGASYAGLAVAGIGVNATYYKLFSISASSSSDSLPYTVATSNSFVVLVGTAGYYNFTTVTIPSTCTKQIRVDNIDTYETAYIATCQNAASGAYTFSASLSGSGSSAMAAYVFPPGNVILDDNPSTATITTNGNTYANGQAMQVIGTNAITANLPSTGNWVFNSWLSSNSLNLTVANALDPSTTLTVIGNGTVTATWENETSTFLETGLPAPFTWNVIYDGALASSSANTISFVNAPGTYQFSISNQIINGNKYVPVPNSGSASTGKITNINFTLEGKPALLVSKNPEAYGNTDLVTANAIPSSDYVELNVSGGIFGPSNIVAGPTESSLSYAFPVVSVDTYTLNALDTNTLESTTVDLTVSKASPAISLPNFPSSFFYNGNTATVTANILTYDNQLPLDLYVNNALVATSNTQTSVQVGPEIGNYVVTAETQGNGNYTSANIIKSFSIEPPPPKTIANYAANAGISTTSPLTVYTSSTYAFYLCAGGAGNGAVTYTSGTVDQYAAGDYAYIGHQTVNGCTETTSNPDLAEAIFGINDTTYTLQDSTGKGSVSLTFNVAEPGSLVAIMISAGDYGFSGAPVIPSGCKELENVTGADTYESAYVAVCPSLAAGSYTASVTVSNAAGKAEIGAYIFPPNYVNLDDVPSTASMVINGTSSSDRSDVILIGQTTANAIAPASSNFVFDGWTASNANITISNAISQNTIITATGNGILTATWNGISTFTESGLPSSTTWNVIYNNVLNSSSTNTISFSTLPGNYLFTVANQIVSGTTYVPSPSTGYLSAGNATAITFASVKACTISLAPNSIEFRSMYAGSNTATTYSVTDNNIGNANAYMLVYGGNWIGPQSFGVSNTTWAPTSGVAFPANRLSPVAYNTSMLVTSGSSNDIYLGVGIPGGAPSGTYSQDITIENSC